MVNVVSAGKKIYFSHFENLFSTKQGPKINFKKYRLRKKYQIKFKNLKNNLILKNEFRCPEQGQNWTYAKINLNISIEK